ncbi:ubiquitin-like domain-containing protein [Streptomyces sp. NPDC056488]|uniref:ubiquitin-like domain-containing protein n=1 Tax=unclassified Streptomyces TaxID=2593676 RepID=UPI0036A940B5
MSTSQGSHRAGRRSGGTAPDVLPTPPGPSVPPGLPLHEQPTQAAPLVVPGGVPDTAPGTVPGQGTRAGARRAARRRRAAKGSTERPAGAVGSVGSTGSSGSVGEGLRRLVPQALVVAFLAGGTTAFVADDKTVRLSVDGVPRTLHTFADDVGELLADEGLAVDGHDIVAPAPGHALTDGDEVIVRYGRPVSLTLDGRRHRVWTTARNVEEALRGLGVRAEGAYLSVSRSAAISRHGLALDVRTERAVTFLADGRERTVRTNAATVGEALAETGITLAGQDALSVDPGSFPRDGQTVAVLRITDSRRVREETVPYAVERVRDPELFAGTEVVERQGVHGLRRITYALRTVNGVQGRPRRLGEEIVREPVSRTVRVGTRRPPASVTGADGLDWAALAACESGGRPDAVDPSGTYGGLYQFDPATWRSLGGTGTAQDAPAAEQTFRAKKLYVQRGASPWPHCGRRLGG